MNGVREFRRSDGRRISHIESTISGLKVEMNTLSQGFQSLANDIRALTERSQQSSRTNWGVIASFIGVSFTIMVFYSDLLLSPLKKHTSMLEHKIEMLEDTMVKHRIFTARMDERARLHSYYDDKRDKRE